SHLRAILDLLLLYDAGQARNRLFRRLGLRYGGDPTMADSRDSGGRALQRILDTPHLAQAVPRLPPALLHRVIQHHGREDGVELVALATREQVRRVFDLDLWRSAKPGLDEQFDARRF